MSSHTRYQRFNITDECTVAGSDQEEIHYKYNLTVIHGKSEYSYKGPVISLMRSSNEVECSKD